MTFYKELILGTHPSNYKQKYVIQGLDANERVYLSNRLKAQNIDSKVWNLHDNVYVDVTQKTTELLFSIWNWQVFFEGEKACIYE